MDENRIKEEGLQACFLKRGAAKLFGLAYLWIEVS